MADEKLNIGPDEVNAAEPEVTEQAAGNFRSIEDFVRDSVQPVNIVWRIRKHNIEIQLADVQEIEHIVTDHMHSLYIK